MPAKSKKRIGKYELGKTIRWDDGGKVKQAVDTEDQTQWAIKVVSRETAHVQMEHLTERLMQLQHPNIVSTREVITTVTHLYFVQENLTGAELFDHVADGRSFAECTVRRYYQQLICGLHYAHKQQIPHANLTLECLWLDDKDRLKITGFDTNGCMPVRDSYKTGPPVCQSPEELMGTGHNAMISDVWSSGVILYAMATGSLPFADPSITVFDKIERAEYSVPADMPDGLKDLLAKIFVADPQNRITIEEIIVHPWFCVDLDPSMFNLFVLRIGDRQLEESALSLPLSDVGISAECAVELLVPQGKPPGAAADCGGCGIAVYVSAPSLGKAEPVCIELSPDAKVADLVACAEEQLGLLPQG
eukprot:TRINITY_DN21332_c0_g1_i1.p1 TRINITY_DN21332_c0_g1~~TRINITY_DN21332_c0_g1_i1.p1  ORF type:complete len:377 (+),score=61.19 TRINITY_DN21332_c0_g1_i1:50-1132(+)